MKEKFEELTSFTLENGIGVLDWDIQESEKEMALEFTLDRLLNVSELRELWDSSPPNDKIFQELVRKGWVSADNTILINFRVDISQNNNEKKIKFRYYVPDLPQNAGLKHMN